MTSFGRMLTKAHELELDPEVKFDKDSTPDGYEIAGSNGKEMIRASMGGFTHDAFPGRRFTGFIGEYGTVEFYYSPGFYIHVCEPKEFRNLIEDGFEQVPEWSSDNKRYVELDGLDYDPVPEFEEGDRVVIEVGDNSGCRATVTGTHVEYDGTKRVAVKWETPLNNGPPRRRTYRPDDLRKLER